MTAKVWTGAVSTDWLDDGNWNPNGDPASGDDVTIGATTNEPILETHDATITVNSMNIAVDSFLIAETFLTVSGGTSLSAGGRLRIFAGELQGSVVADAGSVIEGVHGPALITGTIEDRGHTLRLLIDDAVTTFVLGGASTAQSVEFQVDDGELVIDSTLTLGTAFDIRGIVKLNSAGAALTDASGIALESTGLLFGQGKVTGALGGSGTVTAQEGVLEIVNAIAAADAASFHIASAATLLLDAAPAAGKTYTFDSSSGAFALGDDTGFRGTISGMKVGSDSAHTTSVDIRGHTAHIAAVSGQGTTSGTVTLSDGAVLSFANIGSSEWLAREVSDGNGGTDIFLGSTAQQQSGGVANFPQSDWQIVQTADVTGDGFSDLVWFASSIDTAQFQFVQGTSTVGGGLIPNNPFTGQNFDIVAAGDFNYDGNSDLVWRQQGSGITEIQLLSHGTTSGGGLIANNPFGSSFSVVGAGDFNDDGNSDLVWREQGSGVTEVQFISGNTATGGGQLVNNPFTPDFKLIGVGDFNLDDNSDLVWQQQGSGIVEIQLLSDITTSGGGQIPGNPFDASFSVVGIGDFNSDGRSDLVWQQQNTGVTEIQFLDGNNSLGGGAIANNPFTAGWKVAGVGDFNGDHKSDLVVQNASLRVTEALFLNGLTPIGGGLVTNN